MGEYTLHDFNSFKKVQACLKPGIWSMLENVTHTLEKNAYSAGLGGLFYKCWLGLVGLQCCSNLLFPC